VGKGLSPGSDPDERSGRDLSLASGVEKGGMEGGRGGGRAIHVPLLLTPSTATTWPGKRAKAGNSPSSSLTRKPPESRREPGGRGEGGREGREVSGWMNGWLVSFPAWERKERESRNRLIHTFQDDTGLIDPPLRRLATHPPHHYRRLLLWHPHRRQLHPSQPSLHQIILQAQQGLLLGPRPFFQRGVHVSVARGQVDVQGAGEGA